MISHTKHYWSTLVLLTIMQTSVYEDYSNIISVVF